MEENQKRWKRADRKTIWFLILGAALALLMELALAFSAVRHGFGYEEGKAPLVPDWVEGFEQAGNAFRKNSSNAWLDFTVKKELGYVDISLSQPLIQNTEIELYYTENSSQQFSRFRKVSFFMMEGSSIGRIKLSSGYYERLRLTIDGNFFLDSLEAGEVVPAARLSISSLISQMKLPRLLLFLAVLIPSGWLWKERLEKKQEKKHSPERILYLDAVRVMAALFVIAAHVIEPVSLLQTPQTVRSIVFNGAVLITLTCNLSFFLLSGALLLPYKEETVGSFYRRRALKVVIPFLVYSFFYLGIMCASQMEGIAWLKQAGTDLAGGFILMGPHLWLIYHLIAVYIIAPFFRYMLKNMPEQMEKSLAALILISLSVRTWILYSGQPIQLNVFLDTWPGIFLMGYFLSRQWMRKYDWAIMAGGAVALTLALCLSLYRDDYKAISCNCSILMMFMSGAIFVMMIRMQRWLRPFGKILGFLGRYSYSVLLVHWFVYNGILTNSWTPEIWLDKSIGQILVPIGFISIVSLGIAVIVDNTLIMVLDWLLSKKTVGKKSQKEECI